MVNQNEVMMENGGGKCADCGVEGNWPELQAFPDVESGVRCKYCRQDYFDRKYGVGAFGRRG